MKGDADVSEVRVRVAASARADYTVEIGADTLARLGTVARLALPADTAKIALVSNRRVYDLYGARACTSLRAAGFHVATWLMPDGERYKNLATWQRALEFFAQEKLERCDAVVALGGGVVLDLAGFAAASYLRGINFLSVPTTLLAQIDAAIGGKTGVNAMSGKNAVGAFHHPRVVLIDTNVLETLPRRELTSGWCEAIKHGAVGDKKLFDRTVRYLSEARNLPHADSSSGASAEDISLASLLAAHIGFKARIVRQDEREAVARTDNKSRRILNFGHTVGHALEFVTGYKKFRHGEAVGYGMIAAGEIAVGLGLLAPPELATLRSAVNLAGRLPRADTIDVNRVFSALASDKKSLDGRIKWVLLERIGHARIVDGSLIPPSLTKASVRAALRQT